MMTTKITPSEPIGTKHIKHSEDLPNYDLALEALQAAHNACFNHSERDVLGMSNGPFSGVNTALGIIYKLETENKLLRGRNEDNNRIRLAD